MEALQSSAANLECGNASQTFDQILSFADQLFERCFRLIRAGV